MPTADSKPVPVLAFLTVLADADGARCGGYLAINPAGRPLEFLCTAPVVANRALRVLYGPTLPAFIDGEQIAVALVQKAAIPPLAICTDVPHVLAAQAHLPQPVVWVEVPADEQPSPELPSHGAASEKPLELSPPAAPRLFRVDSSHVLKPPVISAILGRFRVCVDGEAARLAGGLTNLLAPWGDGFDLSEPFVRVREALRETKRGSR